MLKKVRGSLKDGGKAIIAIENKMGMKYFSGAAEDHTGVAFDGINNYINTSGAVTFSKPELTNLLTECGFENLHFYYPMPDYQIAGSDLFRFLSARSGRASEYKAGVFRDELSNV